MIYLHPIEVEHLIQVFLKEEYCNAVAMYMLIL